MILPVVTLLISDRYNRLLLYAAAACSWWQSLLVTNYYYHLSLLASVASFCSLLQLRIAFCLQIIVLNFTIHLLTAISS